MGIFIDGIEPKMMALGLGPRPDAYPQALRHSKRVRLLKILLPVTALVISLIFVGVSWVRTMIPANISIGGVKIENGNIVMERPAISGRNFDGSVYLVNARRALQSIRNPYEITFEDIVAAIPLGEKTTARFSAKTGIFDRAKDLLDLPDPFDIILSSGIEIKFDSARLDIPQGSLVSADPVSIKNNGALIVAQSLQIADKGRVIILDGKVVITISPQSVRQSR